MTTISFYFTDNAMLCSSRFTVKRFQDMIPMRSALLSFSAIPSSDFQEALRKIRVTYKLIAV